jgi:hypothetical protein
MPCTNTNALLLNFWGYHNAAPEEQDTCSGTQCTDTSDDLAVSILRAVKKGLEKAESWKLLWSVGSYIQTYSVKHQKTVMFNNNILFYNTLLFNNAVYYMCVANSNLINIPWSLQAPGIWRTGGSVTYYQGTATTLSYTSGAQQLPDTAIAQQCSSYETEQWLSSTTEHNSLAMWSLMCLFGEVSTQSTKLWYSFTKDIQ